MVDHLVPFTSALVAEGSFADLGILHHPLPLYMSLEGIFLSHPSRLNENGTGNEKYLAEVPAKNPAI